MAFTGIFLLSFVQAGKETFVVSAVNDVECLLLCTVSTSTMLTNSSQPKGSSAFQHIVEDAIPTIFKL